MRTYHPAQQAMWLAQCGWKVRQKGGRRIWYKGQAGAEIVARGMEHAEQLEHTLRRTRAPSLFMYGPQVAELLGSMPPTPRPKPKRKSRKQRAEEAVEKTAGDIRRALLDLDSATFLTVEESRLFTEATHRARTLLTSALRAAEGK